ncbi:DNA alkylation repair protein [Breznakia pachnodae]|uniref:3-methyladenine DNA glycosylase AlkC n=1 Tax=Breznakia pachnodae TaxID=265178 RepID=A0ABU0E0F1_9FIRM|nr:DNA alkylation repair protein [Breznakia pachnodae]MDQ0360343.1 3-methyladenine DNA glycosylase AlkC [Breznakia pachnodae]
MKDIPDDILRQLNNGELESANAVEWFAIDRRKLLETVLSDNNRIEYFKPILKCVNSLEKQTANTLNETIGEGLLHQSKIYNDNNLISIIANHDSDVVRSWGAFMIGKADDLSLNKKFQEIQLFAGDKHFNVREEAWVALRMSVIENLEESLEILSTWVKNEDENIRRFASELTRPRGVWCKHIEVLKDKPELALCILESLKTDESTYVRNSVGNWLNDASKTRPDFVIELCTRWKSESNQTAIGYIIKKAMRTLNKVEK